jgi:hypothetical protein
MLVGLQLVGVPAVPLNVTVLEPCDEPKFVPVIVTEVPRVPEFGLRLVMAGADCAGVPVPLNGMEIRAVVKSLVMSTVPAAGPVPDGTNFALTVQAALTANGDEETQLSVSEKSPVVPTASTLIGPLLTFVSARAWAGLVVPVAWLPKVRDEGDAVNRGRATVTGILTRILCWPRTYVAVMDALPAAMDVVVPVASTVTTLGFDEENEMYADAAR